ncbi:YcbK family protein [Methyloparacoccus murrellii]
MSHQPRLIATPSSLPRPVGTISRRSFLTRATLAAAGALILPPSRSVASLLGTERTLSFHNVHTDEELTIRCCPEQDYDRETRLRFSSLLRDHHADEIREMDPGLIDIFFAMSAFTGSSGPFRILSGYRSPETNSWLRRFSHGVAEHSMHIEGKAVDIRMDDVSTREIRQAGLALAMGGVGYYPRSNFVHLDTGRVRHW